ncbi:hypothetical protein [Blastopirellula marina]|uniref:Uncharacterized protein n=1 Tax=Blastopirellula marina TaxID=124 RepID=A0A2S8GHJ6_9BACT|nr:hypothetical protein [Blastopirellula marina]PQO43923.1 hypothetical protein C5Y93_22330 [Blastopirellula marina]
MPSKQVKDILDHVRAAHQQVKKVCDELRGHEPDARLQLLLEYIGRHEEAFNTALQLYEQDARGKGLLETWLQFSADEAIDEDFAALRLSEGMQADEIVQQVLDFDAKLVALYRDLATSTSSEHVQELFNDLAQLEEDKERQYARLLQD